MVRPVALTGQKLGGYRDLTASVVENKWFTRFITVLIVFNAVTLGIEADPGLLPAYQPYFHAFDRFVISVFVIELLLKLFSYRLSFFRVGWNIFDFLIVAISLVPQGTGLAVLRAFRVFRIFRLITVIPQMRSVVGALFHAIPGMASIIGVLFVIVYVAAVLAMQLFGQHPSPDLQAYYGSIGNSLYTMFQLMTLEDWPDIAAPTMEHYPWSWSFFVTYIMIATFAVLNLFIGIIVDALNIVKEQDLQKEEDVLLSEMTRLHQKMEMLQRDINVLRRDK